VPPDDQKKPNSPAPCFEDALEALEAVVHDLEEGQIGLTEALKRYEQGVKLLRQCYEMLESAERRIELLSRVGAEGEPITQPFDEQSATLEEKASTRSRRRSQPNQRQRPTNEGEDVDARGGLF
jgi:exodeoxyribonuclease VII small subunit